MPEEVIRLLFFSLKKEHGGKLREHHYDLNLSHSDTHAHTDFGKWKHMSDRWSEDSDMNTCLSLLSVYHINKESQGVRSHIAVGSLTQEMVTMTT